MAIYCIGGPRVAKTPQMDSKRCKLVADTREMQVMKNKDHLAGVNYEIKQITHGDYNIIYDNKLIMTIERKSLTDYAASIRDGRHENFKKLIELRSKTGCRIVYIIEGDAFPAPTTKYARIPYANIQSSIFHFMMRDGFQFIYTKDSVHTAQTLRALMASMNTLMNSWDPTELEEQPAQPTVTGSHEELLTAKPKVELSDIVRQVWSAFEGITINSAADFMQHWTLRDVVGGLTADQIAAKRMIKGSKFSERATRSLLAHDMIKGKLLARVPQVSTNMARELLATRSLLTLLEMPIDELAKIKIGQKALGPKKAQMIHDVFSFKF